MGEAAEEPGYESWVLKDETFFKNQSKLRAHLRIERGHEKPVDHVAHVAGIYFNLGDLSQDQEKHGSLAPELNVQLVDRPYLMLSNLSSDEISDLIEDIQEYASFYPDHQEYNRFWEAIRTLAHFYKEIKQSSDPRLRHAEDQDQFYQVALAPEVAPMVADLLREQTSEGLNEVEAEIKALLPSKTFKSDLQFWGAVLKRIEVLRAKKQIEQIRQAHYKVPEVRVERAKQEEKKQLVVHASVSPPLYDSDDEVDGGMKIGALGISEQAAREEWETHRAELLVRQVKKMQRELKLKTEEEKKDIYRLRGLEGDENVRFRVERSTAWEEKMLKLLQDHVEQDEEIFADQVTQSRLGRSWEAEQEEKDKFELRKPRYFNTRKTGFEWNKFNQNHYKEAKSPPKIIVGYKFNIFYPDLLDKFKTPQFHLSESDIQDMLTIRFEAGAPYEDIAFRIVAREWDLNEHAGYLCVFDKGVLHLHFNFKTFKYRR